MTDFAEHTKSHWFPVALSRDLRSLPLQVMLFGEPIVVARLQSGRVLALEDRCPHRGVPLSGGRIYGDSIQCPYHGWTFNADGLCVSMPGANCNTPIGTIHQSSFAVREQDGLIWILKCGERPMPERISAMKPGSRRFLEVMTWDAPILEAQENFLDALHTHLVHPGLVRRNSKRRAVSVNVRAEGDGFCVDYIGQADQTGILFKLFESSRTEERAHFSGLSVAQIEYRYKKGWAAFITLCFSPATSTSTKVFAMLHVEDKFAPSWLVRLLVWPFLRKVASQDARILKLQNVNRAYFPNHRHVVTRLDVVRNRLEVAWRSDENASSKNTEITIYL
ncbi:MAG TPA: aromatic ring-hydroxylating dioxygenase subunit alpha [Steroidobacteraceae bacterium]|nr:aromatic ring-hydroxylating dioxygenase subunit alpha [Steroidobacteraceae bacterium]